MTHAPTILVLRHVDNEALGTLPAALARCGLSVSVLDCFDSRWPPAVHGGFDPRQYAGLIVMGGTMNANQVERFPFLATEVSWLQTAVAAELPVLGICLGAQLLAKSLGGRVFANPTKEIGWHEVELLDAARDDHLLAGAAARETVFQWHGDTFELPSGAVQLARSAACASRSFASARVPTACNFIRR